MKRLWIIFTVLATALSFCGCTETKVNQNANVTLTFVYGDVNVSVSLPEEECEKVIAILNGNKYDPLASGVPACGFDKNISLTVGNRVYAIARDTCGTVQDLGNLKYFSISQEDVEYIHTLFQKHGGYFPCI